ncbi:MAG: cytochrome c oxidase accessory protein CcoG [Bacteroidia bacterium]
MITSSHIEENSHEDFRDSIATVTKEGKRAWVYPAKPKGRYYTLRGLISIIYLALFFGLPFLKVQGEPLFLINVVERKFILFGSIFWPQDFFIFGLGMLIFIVFVALFTVVYGRFFCGWACPQTIFMEMLFRKIEYWIDGDANYQKALQKAPWDFQKILRRAVKYVLFFALSVLIANTFLAYVIGIDQLFAVIKDPISAHKAGFAGMLLFSGIFFFIYAWFREQVCLIVCPYGRMQGVLLDKDSIVVAYDYKRGEPRSKFKKQDTIEHGDCVDCGLCVKVCPTGIDIRNGTQLECINCTACIDVCDTMMEGIKRPKGLIRYDSENGIRSKKGLRLTTRMKAYTAVLLILVGLEVVLLSTRSDYDATVLRAKGLLFQEQPHQQVSNLYTIKLVNKTRDSMPVVLKVENMNGMIQMVGKELIVKKEGITEGEFFVFLHKKDIRKRKTQLRIGVYSNNKKIKTIKTNFLGPVQS